MRKFIFPLVLGVALVSCKKEEVKTTAETKTETPTDARTKEEIRTTELLQTKNDTLYVTNFFATWCGPCVKEIPHFKEVMEETKAQPVKFTFINLDDKADWETEVMPFIKKHQIEKNTILLDSEQLSEDFFTKNFKTWKGEFIPYTMIRKGEKTEEIGGGISKETLVEKMKSL